MIFVSLCLVFALVLLGMIEADESVLFSCVVLRDVVILMSGLHSFAFSSEVQTPNLLLLQDRRREVERPRSRRKMVPIQGDRSHL